MFVPTQLRVVIMTAKVFSDRKYAHDARANEARERYIASRGRIARQQRAQQRLDTQEKLLAEYEAMGFGSELLCELNLLHCHTQDSNPLCPRDFPDPWLGASQF